ncbi:hypothetical protein [Pedobacter steynii]|uniref:Uncharacterized protein n=1 Tax=Pedobacter steynii TaxID=430522 RepID=A0A1D7QJL5_9SPHI|nr:hypothetical protein [Pedobacter steynii]AOM78868.1 hypothetical protein BFS30_17845 [Pedobacter steynii]
MKNQKKPKPDPIPKFRSSTDHRSSEELPAEENLNDQQQKNRTTADKSPKPDLGNDRTEDEDEREKLITP